jgi:murein DD-endopeptidase MepM/ murein hydrolase activator NlpD
MTYRPFRPLAAGALALLVLAAGCGDDPAASDPELELEAVAEPQTPAPPPPPSWIEEDVTVQRGQVITSILEAHGLDYSDALAVVNAAKDVHDLARIRLGETFIVRKDRDTGAFAGMVYPLDRYGERRLVVERSDDGGFLAAEDARPTVRVPVAVAGQVESSLWATGMAMGLSAENLVSLAGIFEWEIDFNTQIRPGDRFRMVIEAVDDAETGERLRLDTVLAAEYETASGKSFVGVRYEDAEEKVGYFDAEGNSSKKMFLKSPLKFSRVSSRFGSRYHPVLKKWRAHKGTDYAAGSGTPVRAIGRGVVEYKGSKGGYGRHVRIKHSGTHSSSYSHLSKYAVRSGQTVEQGEVIGYVGSSGLATGPHLHFEFYVGGKQVDFLRQQFPRSEPIDASERVAFEAVRDQVLPQLAAVAWPLAAVADATDTTEATDGGDTAEATETGDAAGPEASVAR